MSVRGRLRIGRLGKMFGVGEDDGRARVPSGQRVYAVGDVHGRLDLLDLLWQRIEADRRSAAPETVATIVMLGDYVDRGPDSAGVLARLAAGPPPGFGLICLCGNHDEMVLSFLADPERLGSSWFLNGGLETLESFGVATERPVHPSVFPALRDAFAARLSVRDVAFLQGLRDSVSIGGYFFAHAGVAPGVPLDAQRREDLLWIREPFLESTRDHGKVVVHGHTIHPVPVVRRNRIGIDTGAYASGRLTAVVLENDHVRFLDTRVTSAVL